MRAALRPVGRGHRLALIDDFIFWNLWTDGIQEMIDAHDGNIESLADIEDYRSLAEAPVEMDTVTAFLSSESQAQSHVADVYRQVIDDPDNNERRQTLVEEIQRPLLLRPYLALATGAGIDENGYFMAIVLMNPSEAVAQENAALLEQRISEAKNVVEMREWSDLIQSMEIEGQGRLTLAKLYGSVCTHWGSFEVLGAGPYEPLLLHE